jgi:hypothetical protein
VISPPLDVSATAATRTLAGEAPQDIWVRAPHCVPQGREKWTLFLCRPRGSGLIYRTVRADRRVQERSRWTDNVYQRARAHPRTRVAWTSSRRMIRYRHRGRR